MKVLVTGATGFIGRKLCERLMNDGHQVLAAYRSAEKMASLPVGIETVQIISIGANTDWSEALVGVDAVVHLAARVHIMRETSADPLKEFTTVNVDATVRLAEQAIKAGVKRFIFMSTIGVNGGSSEKNSFTEADTPAPHNMYSISKKLAEDRLSEMVAGTGMELVMLRAPLVYGPGSPGNFRLLLRAVEKKMPLPLASAHNHKSFIYFGNLIDALATCTTHPKARGVYLVSDGEDISTPDLIKKLGTMLGKPTRLFPVPIFLIKLVGKIIGKYDAIDRLVGSLTIDSSKIRRELDWKPPYTMEQGLQKTVTGWKQAKKKKVMLVCNSSWALWHFRRSVINYFVSINCDVILFCPYEKKHEEIKMKGVSFYDWNLSLEGGNPFDEIKSILELRRILKKEKPEFVFNYSIKPSIYGSIARIGLSDMKMVSLLTGLGFVFLSNKMKARVGRFLYYLFLRFSDEVWFLNKDDLHFFLEQNFIKSEKTFILPGEGVDINRFALNKLTNNKIRKILFIGRLLKDKGLLHLVEAAEILNAKEKIVDIQILGPSWFENPNSLSKAEFENLRNNKYVSYLGQVDDVVPYIKEVDAVCLPSFREGVPVVLLEAGAMGKALLATNVAGCREVVIEGVNGMLCEPHSTADLVRMIRDFLKLSEEDLVRISHHSREHVIRNFSTEIVLEKYKDFMSK